MLSNFTNVLYENERNIHFLDIAVPEKKFNEFLGSE